MRTEIWDKLQDAPVISCNSYKDDPRGSCSGIGKGVLNMKLGEEETSWADPITANSRQYKSSAAHKADK